MSTRQVLPPNEHMRSILFELNPNISILFDRDLYVVDCNTSARKFFKFDSRQELIDGFFERVEAFTPQLRGHSAEMMRDAIEKTIIDGKVRFETDFSIDNSPIRVAIDLEKIPIDDSFVISLDIVNLTEFTELQMLEQKYEVTLEQNIEFRYQMAKLDIIIQATNIAILEMEIVDKDPLSDKNLITFTNEFAQMLGYTKEELKQTPAYDPEIDGYYGMIMFNAIIHPEDRDEAYNELRAHLTDYTGQTPFNLEYRLRKKDGDYVYTMVSGETFRDGDGNAIRFIFSHLDITESKRLIFEVEESRIRAEEANKAKSSFLSVMSHEIRTPMNAILGITEIQLQNPEIDKDVHEALEKIYSSGDLLLGIINDILDLSKIEAGKLELLIDKYELASLISDTAQLNVMRIASKPIEFEVCADENLPIDMMGDVLRVKQIFNNLLSNAFKYTDSGTVTFTIQSKDSPTNDNEIILMFSVKDTGHGMSKEQLDKLFDEYSRFNAEAHRSTEGTGLGMSITRNLLEMMNGEIFIESEIGVGSTFTVHIPQGKTGAGPIGKEIADNLQKFRSKDRSQMRGAKIAREHMPYGSVLIVDDVETNIYVAKGLMTPYHMKIEAAMSGFEAIDKVKAGEVYDIIFMDHMMPKLDGIETTRLIREHGYTNPVVALTANAVAGQAEVFLKNGFDDFISKPIDIRQLNMVLNKFVRDKQPASVVEAARLEAGSIEVKETPKVSPEIIEIFIRDSVKSLAELEEVLKSTLTKESMRTIVIHVHGLKSALGNIDKKELSKVAAYLEDAGKNEETDILTEKLPPFLEKLKTLLEELKPQETNNEPAADFESNKEFLHEKLSIVKEACDEYDERIAEPAMAELKTINWSSDIKKQLDEISEHLLHSDFDEAAEIADTLLDL